MILGLLLHGNPPRLLTGATISRVTSPDGLQGWRALEDPEVTAELTEGWPFRYGGGGRFLNVDFVIIQVW